MTNEPCYAEGPDGYEDMFDWTRELAERQAEKAMELLDDRWPKKYINDSVYSGCTYFRDGYHELSGPISFASQFIDMRGRPVTLDDGSTSHTCAAAMGYSMWAGPMDGPTGFLLQGVTENNWFIDNITGLAPESPSEEQAACHEPKPILINAGEVSLHVCTTYV